MSWRDRATPVKAGSWRDRATPMEPPPAEAPPSIQPVPEEPRSLSSRIIGGLADTGAAMTVGPIGLVPAAAYAVGKQLGVGGAKPSPFGAAVTSAKQVNPFSDEMVGALEAALGNDYRAARERERAEAAEAAKAQPLPYYATQLGGAAAMPGGATKSLPKAIAQMALLGGVTAAGTSTADLTKGDVGGLLKDTGFGVGTGGALAGAGGFVGNRLRPLLQDFAAKRAIKATGAIQSDIAKESPQRLLEMGRELLRKETIPVLGNKREVLKRALQEMRGAGSLMESALQQADDVAAKTGQPFDWSQVLHRVNTEVREKLGATGQRLAGGALKSKTGGYAPSFFDDIAQEAAEGGGFTAANRIKSEIADAVYGGGADKLQKRVAKKVERILNDEIEKQLGDRVGGQIADEFLQAKKTYGAMKLAEKGAKRGMARQTGNQFLGLPELGAGGATAAALAAATQNPWAALGGLGVALAGKLAKERGSAVTGRAAHGIAESAPVRAISRDPRLLAAGGRALLTTRDEIRALLDELRKGGRPQGGNQP